ncbi:hypothetical protein [Actinoplanes sp. NPDC049802]|uniref:restriction system modified-DNA reader domain-containing protein n=1 Tax=Actinoplanes sp. NPDC049802 TaxID=3154742 RepID=UPI0033C7A123
MSSESHRRRDVLVNGRRVRVLDLIEAGLLDAGQTLVYQQRLGIEPHLATVTAKGRLALPDGREYNTPSGAAAAAANDLVRD